MKAHIWLLSTDNGDGSCSVSMFATEEQARVYMAGYDNDFDTQTQEDNLSCRDLEFNDEGILLNPDTYEDFS